MWIIDNLIHNFVIGIKAGFCLSGGQNSVWNIIKIKKDYYETLVTFRPHQSPEHPFQTPVHLRQPGIRIHEQVVFLHVQFCFQDL